VIWDLWSLCDKADYAIIRYAINWIQLYYWNAQLSKNKITSDGTNNACSIDSKDKSIFNERKV